MTDRDKRESRREHEEFGESYRTDTKAEPDEQLNSFYTRKQRPKGNKLASDCDAEFAGRDRDAEVDNYKADRDAGPMNYKRWDRYGGK
jgi:hypothetical protein